MVDVKGLRDIHRESQGEFYLATLTAAGVVAIGVEQGILLAIALSLLRHVRHSYRPHTMVLAPNATGRWAPAPATPGKETEPGLIIYRFGADFFMQTRIASSTKCAPSCSMRRRRLVGSSSMQARSRISTTPLHRPYGICSMNWTAKEFGMVFARVSSYLRSDMDRHGITAAIGETQIFTTLHEAIAAVRFGALSSRADGPHSNV